MLNSLCFIDGDKLYREKGFYSLLCCFPSLPINQEIVSVFMVLIKNNVFLHMLYYLFKNQNHIIIDDWLYIVHYVCSFEFTFICLLILYFEMVCFHQVCYLFAYFIL